MKDKYEKYLPVGSVVLLNNAQKRIMVTGFVVQSKEESNKKIYDYIGCLYPEGVVDTEKNLLFNHEDIAKIYAIGYSDAEEKDFKERLKQKLNEVNNAGL